VVRLVDRCGVPPHLRRREPPAPSSRSERTQETRSSDVPTSSRPSDRDADSAKPSLRPSTSEDLVPSRRQPLPAVERPQPPPTREADSLRPQLLPVVERSDRDRPSKEPTRELPSASDRDLRDVPRETSDSADRCTCRVLWGSGRARSLARSLLN